MSLCEWVKEQEPDFLSDRSFKVRPKWDKCINMLGIILQNNNIQQNKDTTFNIVMISHLIFMTKGT
jgi:hypothetical protein